MSLRKLKLGEYGKQLFFNSGVDISDATSFTVEFTKPFGDVVTVNATLGTEDVTGKDQNCNDVTFFASQYTIYQIPMDFLDEAGCWLYRSINPTSADYIPGDQGTFEVVDA